MGEGNCIKEIIKFVEVMVAEYKNKIMTHKVFSLFFYWHKRYNMDVHNVGRHSPWFAKQRLMVDGISQHQ